MLYNFPAIKFNTRNLKEKFISVEAKNLNIYAVNFVNILYSCTDALQYNIGQGPNKHTIS